jgi:hypothetical protein
VGTNFSEDLAAWMKKASHPKLQFLLINVHIPQDWYPQIILVRTIMHKLYILRHNLMQNFAYYTQTANPFIMYWK